MQRQASPVAASDAVSEPRRGRQSIFPTYDPNLPLAQQKYVPTRSSLIDLPRAAISRQFYFESDPSVLSPLPASSPSSDLDSRKLPVQWPASSPPSTYTASAPEPSTTDHLRKLWKAANGWKPAASEGDRFCLTVAQQKANASFILLSSSSQPFYSFRLDATSASLHIRLARYNPGKFCRSPGFGARIASRGRAALPSKHWHRALEGIVEDGACDYPPKDGLVAFFMPSKATQIVLSKYHQPNAFEMAQSECARLVWDGDAKAYFLSHPALATPFCVAIEPSPAYSRVEYKLEHRDSSLYLARLTRNAIGGGWMEIDTQAASEIDSLYVIDVAVSALLFVAASREQRSMPGSLYFEPPPSKIPPKDLGRKHEFDRYLSWLGPQQGYVRNQRKIGPSDSSNKRLQVDVTQNGGGHQAAQAKQPPTRRGVAKVTHAMVGISVSLLTIALECSESVCKAICKAAGDRNQ